MPRDINGNYTLPAGNPVFSGTIIESSWANTTLSDIEAALTDSLSRTGAGGLLVPMKFADGVVGSPGIAWANEPTLGWYRAGLNDMRAVVAGVGKMQVHAGGVNVLGGLGVSGAATFQGTMGVLGAVNIEGGLTVNNPLVVNGNIIIPNNVAFVIKNAANVDIDILHATPADQLVFNTGGFPTAFFFAGANPATALKIGLDVNNVDLYSGAVGAEVVQVRASSGGVAITNTLTVGGLATLNNGLLVASSMQVFGNGASIQLPTVGTSQKFMLLINTGNPGFYLGIESSVAGGFFTGSQPYESVLYGANNLFVNCGSILRASGLVAAKTFSATSNSNSAVAYLGNTLGAGFTSQMLRIQFTGYAPNTNANYFLYADDTIGARFLIWTNGGIANYQANNANISDARAKKDIVIAPDYTDFVERLAYQRFSYIDNPNAGEVDDVIAQDLEQYAPELVVPFGDAGMKGVLTHRLQSRINSVIPKLIARIKALEARP